MLGVIIKKEIQENLYSYKYVVIMLLTVVLVFTSLFVMYHDYRQRVADYEALLPDKGKSSALLRPTSLAIFSKGMDEALCSQYRIAMNVGISAGQNQHAFNTMFRVFDTPDLFYVISVILSLCAVLFSFNLVTSEKEAGTLRQTLACSLERTRLVAGKWIGGFCCLALPFVLSFLLGLTLVSFAPEVQISREEYIKLALFLAGSLLYLAFFFSLGLAASSAYSRSSSALILAVSLWVFFVFVLPGLGSIAAARVVNIPSVQKFTVLKHQVRMKKYMNFYDNVREKGSVENIDLRQLDPENEAVVADYRGKLGSQIALTRAFTRASPASAFNYLAADLANTGILERLNLKRAYLAYKDIYLSHPMDVTGEVKGDYPAFTYQRLSLMEVLRGGGLVNFTILILQNVALFAAVYVLFLRYDVR